MIARLMVAIAEFLDHHVIDEVLAERARVYDADLIPLHISEPARLTLLAGEVAGVRLAKRRDGTYDLDFSG